MSLNRVVDAFADHLGPLTSPTPVGPVRPGATTELPAVALSLAGIEQALTSIGATPAPSRRGALPVARDVDLADPTITFPDGEIVDLLSGDRRRLHFPFGPVVAAGGEPVLALAPADLTVLIGGAGQAVVADAPTAGQVQGRPDTGEIVFDDPLPAAGTLRIEFFVGQWEVSTARYQGELTIEALADDPTIEPLSRQIVDALDGLRPGDLPGLQSLRPLRLGPITTTALGPTDGDGQPRARSRTAAYRFDFEVETPDLGSGGGLIERIVADGIVDDLPEPERFDIPV